MTIMAIQPDQKPRLGSLAHREYRRERGCTKKIQYSAEFVAANAALILTWVDESFRGMEPYLCEFCDHFHVGHSTARENS